MANIHPFACTRCTARKVRCDKQDQCDACRRHNVQCTYRPIKYREKQRNADTSSLMKRLKQYEELIQKHGLVAAGNTKPEKLIKPAVAEQHGNEDVDCKTVPFRPSLISDAQGTKLVDNNLWSRVGSEMDSESAHSSSEEDEQGAKQDKGTSSTTGSSGYLQHSVAGTVSLAPNKARILWDVYLERVNPLVHVTHIPTLEPAIIEAIRRPDIARKDVKCLWLAIQSVALFSLTPAECRTRLGEDKSSLLKALVSATKVALTAADFMGTSSLMVLQALILHIFAIRHFAEPRAVWTLTGLTVRIAQGMGMQYDGTMLDLPPFETEIRRRVWWQLKMHDFRAAELCGQNKFTAFEFEASSPKWPINVSDADLVPGMKDMPTPSVRPTEMLWCMLRYELIQCAAAQKIKAHRQNTIASDQFISTNDVSIEEDFLDRLQETLETKFLRYCDTSQPLHFTTSVGVRLSLSLLRFLSHHPRKWQSFKNVPDAERQLVWRTALELLVQYNVLQSNEQLSIFAWHIGYFIQWHAVIHVLDNLRTPMQSRDVAKAWSLIDVLFENNLELLLCTDRPLFVALGNLCLKAVKASSRDMSMAPTYISKLQALRKPRKFRTFRFQPSKEHVSEATTGSVQSDTPTLVHSPSVATSATLQPTPPELTGEQANIYPSDTGYWLAMNQTPTVPDLLPMPVDDSYNLDCGLLPETHDSSVDWDQWDQWMTGLEFDVPANPRGVC